MGAIAYAIFMHAAMRNQNGKYERLAGAQRVGFALGRLSMVLTLFALIYWRV